MNADLLQANILSVPDVLSDVCPVGTVNIVSNYWSVNKFLFLTFDEYASQKPFNENCIKK